VSLNTLEQWLRFIERNHPSEIDMGLDRCSSVFTALNIRMGVNQNLSDIDADQTSVVVITVAGTNGKGTTCAFIEQACLKAGLRVGVYSSPHLISFCERIRINSQQITEPALCAVFETIESKRGNTTLTYFEYATLAALQAFSEADLDVVVLEVGLGGRLDAVNIVDPNIAVITSIGLDHQNYLGDTKEKIGFEKAGVFRASIPTVIGEPNCPQSMLKKASDLAIEPMLIGKDFFYNERAQSVKVGDQYFDVTKAKILKQNVATAIAALSCLATHIGSEHKRLLNADNMQYVIENTHVIGRHQLLQKPVLDIQPAVIADVAHNEDSALQLRKMIEQYDYNECHIVVGMLKDKNIEVSLQAFTDMKIAWYCATLPSARGENSSRIASAAANVKTKMDRTASIDCFDDPKTAYAKAIERAKPNDIVLVMGSFLTVAAVLAL